MSSDIFASRDRWPLLVRALGRQTTGTAEYVVRWKDSIGIRYLTSRGAGDPENAGGCRSEADATLAVSRRISESVGDDAVPTVGVTAVPNTANGRR